MKFIDVTLRDGGHQNGFHWPLEFVKRYLTSVNSFHEIQFVELGYWKQKELTSKAMADGWMKTGDGAKMDKDGYVYIVDRVKDMIISGGENIYSTEVENAIYQMKNILECAVIGIPDEKWGETVHAIVRLKKGEKASEKEIIEHCHKIIAGFKCPKSISFREEPMPVSGAGKILKTELRKSFWEDSEKQVN